MALQASGGRWRSESEKEEASLPTTGVTGKTEEDVDCENTYKGSLRSSLQL